MLALSGLESSKLGNQENELIKNQNWMGNVHGSKQLQPAQPANYGALPLGGGERATPGKGIISETNVDGLFSERGRQNEFQESDVSVKYKNMQPLVNKNSSLFQLRKGEVSSRAKKTLLKKGTTYKHTLLQLSQLRKSTLKKTMSEEALSSHSEDEQEAEDASIVPSRLTDRQTGENLNNRTLIIKKKLREGTSVFDDRAQRNVDKA